MRAQLVGDQQLRCRALSLKKLAHQPQRRPAVTPGLNQHVEHLAFMVDGTPEIHPLAGDIGNARAWRDTFGEQLPDLEFRIWPDAGNLADIEYLAFMHPDFDSLPVFSNLKAMFSRSAGVEPLVNHPKLPNAPLLKIEPPGGDPMMTEYVVMHVLRLHRDMPGNGRYQRVFPVAACFSDGPLTDPTADPPGR
jgi:hypothetical protein